MQCRTRHLQPAKRRRRHGAAYLLVLGAGLVLSVIGFGIMTASRSASRTASQQADIDEASTLAESAVECALALINNTSTWRTVFTSGVESPAVTVGRGTMSIKLVDETDGNLSNNSSDAVRLYGIGRVGSATRIYSVQLIGTGSSLDILDYGAQTGGNATIASNFTVIGGPISANGTASVAGTATLTGSVQGMTTSVSGTATGGSSTYSSAKAMPATAVFDTYKAQATEILFSSLSTGTMAGKVLSPASNPYGTANANGVYYVHVPSSGTFTLRQDRLVATLIVELDAGAKFATSNVLAWEPPRTDYPTVIIKGQSTCTVDFNGSTSTLNEASLLTNFNPTGTPYPYIGGTSDSDTVDSYTSQIKGVIHVIGTGFTTSFGSNININGVVIVEGNATFGSNGKITLDSTISNNPPPRLYKFDHNGPCRRILEVVNIELRKLIG